MSSLFRSTATVGMDAKITRARAGLVSQSKVILDGIEVIDMLAKEKDDLVKQNSDLKSECAKLKDDSVRQKRKREDTEDELKRVKAKATTTETELASIRVKHEKMVADRDGLQRVLDAVRGYSNAKDVTEQSHRLSTGHVLKTLDFKYSHFGSFGSQF